MRAFGRINLLIMSVFYISFAVPSGPAWALHVLVRDDSGKNTATIASDPLPAIWPPDQRSLTYWIDSKEFCGWRGARTEPCKREDIVAASLAEAAKDWRNSCPECGVSFVRVNDKHAATFTVRYVETVKLKSGGTREPIYIARSFFPTSLLKNRVLRISPKYFRSSMDRVGVLRHEYGHILGYAHENTCPGKRASLPPRLRSLAMTQLDDRSVMNSPCETPASGVALTLSPMDVAGHKMIYGPTSK